MKKWYFLGVLLLSMTAFSQTGVVITYYDNTQQQFNVQTTGKLFFSGDNLQIQIDDTVTQPTSIPVTIIQRITFTNNLSTTQHSAAAIRLNLFPNPGSEYIQISSADEEILQVKIYNNNGQLLQNGSYFPMQNIDVSNLESGIYLVQVNGVTLKFVKR
ncbi:T9SS type A sorting domain-containing protein [Flavobacterium stagni]|uniref:T9SS type A sorting domain-containing protein n=1 Tax=Flavobacterium stagni TaxID=2506421 RepID=A0A4V1N2N0_9FLAO|nr:T9SS type A sorting domain-containing protein [Flavobacterium stagni]RXR22564.1 T9SS type A sorting domain-containing protein [Flavobacterium stagni]